MTCNLWIWLHSLCEAPCLVLEPEATAGCWEEKREIIKWFFIRAYPLVTPTPLVTEFTMHLVHVSGKSKSSRGRWKLYRPSWGSKPFRGSLP